MRLDDRIHRARLFAEAAENTFGQVDIVTRGTTGTVGTLIRFDRDCHGRANCFTQFAGDATLFPVRVTTQCVQTTETYRLRRFLFRVFHRDLAREHVAAGQRHALEELAQHQATEKSLIASILAFLFAQPCINSRYSMASSSRSQPPGTTPGSAG